MENVYPICLQFGNQLGVVPYNWHTKIGIRSNQVQILSKINPKRYDVDTGCLPAACVSGFIYELNGDILYTGLGVDDFGRKMDVKGVKIGEMTETIPDSEMM